MADFEKVSTLVGIYKTGTNEESKAAAEELVKDHIAFIRHVINQRYSSYYKNPTYREDIEQCAIMGFLGCLAKYDDSKGALTTYSITFIQHEVSGFIDQQLSNITPHYSATLRKINKVIADLQQEGITKINMPLLVLETGLTENRIGSALSVSKISEQVDDPQDLLSTGYADKANMSPMEYLEKNETSELLENALNAYCTDDEIVAVKWKFRLLYPDKTERDMSKMLGITVDKFRALVQSGIRGLKKNKRIKTLFDRHEKRENYIDSGDMLVFINDEDNQRLMHDLLFDDDPEE